MNLQEFTSQAEKLGYKKINDTYEDRFGDKIYGFTYEKSDYHIYHWFKQIGGHMYFDHTYSTDYGWTKKKPNKQALRLMFGY